MPLGWLLAEGKITEVKDALDMERDRMRDNIAQLQEKLDEAQAEVELKEEELFLWEERLHQIHHDNEVKLRLARSRAEGARLRRPGAGAARTEGPVVACAGRRPGAGSCLGGIAEGNEESSEGSPSNGRQLDLELEEVEGREEKVAELAQAVNSEVELLKGNWATLVELLAAAEASVSAAGAVRAVEATVEPLVRGVRPAAAQVMPAPWVGATRTLHTGRLHGSGQLKSEKPFVGQLGQRRVAHVAGHNKVAAVAPLMAAMPRAPPMLQAATPQGAMPQVRADLVGGGGYPAGHVWVRSPHVQVVPWRGQHVPPHAGSPNSSFVAPPPMTASAPVVRTAGMGPTAPGTSTWKRELIARTTGLASAHPTV